MHYYDDKCLGSDHNPRQIINGTQSKQYGPTLKVTALNQMEAKNYVSMLYMKISSKSIKLLLHKILYAFVKLEHENFHNFLKSWSNSNSHLHCV